MKNRFKRRMKQWICSFLCICMLLPNVAPIISFAAMSLGNMPRHVDFTRPSALTLRDLGLASGSDAVLLPAEEEADTRAEETPAPEESAATPSNATLRAPEDYYDIETDEPDGELVEFTNGYRTYQIDDGTYTTIFGGYSGYYADEDGTVWAIDNTLSPDGWAEESDDTDDDEMEEDSEDIMLLNDLGGNASGRRLQFGSVSFGKATASNASPSNASGKRGVPSYENRSGAMKVSIPKVMTRTEGIQVSLDGAVMEFIPLEGDFSRSMVRDNAIRYSDVFEGIDFQYTVIGNGVKEDIILLERTERNSFSFQLDIPGLKAVQVKDRIEIRRSGKSDPLLILEAPSMTDADGGRSLALDLELSGTEGSYVATVTADRQWLDDEDRAYPVRIDPAPMIPADEFYMITVAEGRPNTYLGWDHVPTVGYVDDTTLNSRVYLLFNNQNDQHMQDIMAAATECLEATLTVTAMTNNSDHNTVIQVGFPDGAWPYQRPTWNTKPPVKKTAEGEDWLISAPAPGIDQKIVYDVTTYMNDCIMGRSIQAGFMLRAQVEAKSTGATVPFQQKAECFYNRDSAEHGPRVEITWSGELPGAPELSKLTVDDTTIRVDPAPAESEIGGRTASGVVAHGLAQAGADIYYTIKETETGGEEPEETTEAADTIQYIDFGAAGLDSAKAPIKKSNWQTTGQQPEQPLKYDTIYEVDAYAVGLPMDEEGEPDSDAEPVTGKTVTSDKFLLYRVQQHDLVKRIAKHYEVSPEQIARDNQLYDGQLTEAGTVIFIRNPGKSEPYTPAALKDTDLLLLISLLLGLNPNCVLGLEPINMNTGNFFMQQTDADLEELGGTFAITRSYNSLDTDYRSAFGMGWVSPLEEHLTILGDGRVYFKRGDGMGMAFTKDGDGYKAPEGYDTILETLDSLDTVTDDMDDTEEGGEGEAGDGTDADMEAADSTEGDTGSLAMLLADLSTEYADGADGTTDGETEEGGEEEAPSMPQVAGWKMTDLDGTVRVFDSLGFLQYTEDRKGNRTTYVYNKDYELKRVETATGKVFEITMDEEYRITEIALPNGGTISYEYDEDKNLTSVIDPEGGVRRYEYDDLHRMTAWYDENGSCVIENTYDGEGRVVEQTDANGNTAYLEYRRDSTRMTDNRGNDTIYAYDDQKRTTAIHYPDGTSELRTYGEDGHVASVTDEAGNTTSYTYDEAGNILTERRADGAAARYAYNGQNLPTSATDYEGNTTTFIYDGVGNLLSMTDGEGNTTRYAYDGKNRLAAMTDANGGTTTFEYDGAVVTALTDGGGNTWTFTYDEMNRMLTSTDPLGHMKSFTYNLKEWNLDETAEDGGTTAYEFDAAGCVLAITDANGTTTNFAYDKMHNIIHGEDALGNTLDYVYDGNYNKIAKTDAKGNATQYEYDSRNRLVRITDALGHVANYTLDEKGNVVETTDRRGNTVKAEYDTVLGLPVKVTDALGNATTYRYDRNGNLTETGYPDGTSVSYRYDRAGRMVGTTAQNGLETRISYDGNGNVIRVMDDETRVYRFRYDHANRLVEAVDPLGGVTAYAYDGAGNQTQVTDANSHTTGYAYDAVGRLEEIQDALGGTASAAYDLMGNTLSGTDANGNTTQFHYDVIGQVLAQVDAAGNITAMEYDSLGNVTKVIDALKGETAYDVDALSRTVKMTDALGGEYSYEYDENGNLLKITMPDGDIVNMSYDAGNRMTHYRDEASVVTRYEYDSMGRITKAIDTAGNVMTYEYDESGNLVRQTDTIGRDAIYEYDKFNRLTSVTGTDLATTTYAYDSLGRLTSVTQADGTVTAYEYDPVGNLIKTTEPGEAVYTYAYDAINRLTGKVNPLGASTTFQYDAKGNLTGTVDGEGNTNAYVYDMIDRLTTFTDGRGNNTAFEYDELSRLLSHTTPEGNKNEYRYDALGRMTKAKDPNGLITEYQYDVMGNLVEAISPKGARTTYTYDKHDELTSVTDPAGNVTRYAVDLNRRVTELTQKNGAKYQYTYDPIHRLTSIETPLGLKRELTYDVADNVTKDTDNLGRTNTYEYDIMHRMTKSVNAEGGVTTYGYDIRGNQNQLNNALGYTWNYQYDLVDQLTASVDPEGKAMEVAYNLVGEIESITKPGSRKTDFQYDGNYNVTAISDPKGYIYQYAYDKDNRMVGTKNPLGETTATVYDPGSRVTSVTDRMGLTESYGYDPHGNVLSVKATNGLITRFQYDILDNLVKVTMPSNLTATYTYDVMGNVTSATDTMLRTTRYTYDAESNMTSITDAMGRKETFAYDIGGRNTGYTSNGGNKISYDYDRLNGIVEKSYEDARDPESKEGVLYGYDVLGQRVSMMDRSGESKYEYDGLGRITKVTSGSGEVTRYAYDGCDQLESITYADGKKVSYEYDKNDNLTRVTDRTGAETTYVYDAINRVTEIHRPNGVSTYNTYNARDQITDMKNICDDCEWVISEYHYTYDDRGFIVGEDVTESLYAYAWDDKHDGKHENWHDDKYPHGDKHINKHAKDGIYNFQIIGTKRTFEYDDDGKLTKATEVEDRQGTYVYDYGYDDMGNRTSYSKSRNGKKVEGAYTYNAANQMTAARLYDGKHYKNVEYTYDADGNRIMQEEIKDDGDRKVELIYDYSVENRLKAVSDKNDLLVAMAYDGDGNRIFQLNYNLHSDDDWKGNSGNGNGNNKDNSGSGNSGNGTGSKSLLDSIVGFFTGDDGEPEEETETTATASDDGISLLASNKDKDKDNDGNDKNNGVGNGNGNNKPGKPGNNGNGNGNNGNGNSGNNGNTSTGDTNDNNGNAGGNTNNTGGSQNQSGILFPIDGEVSELEEELIGMIKTTGKEKNYELVEYVNDVNREHVEVLMELNINGIMDTAYSYGNQRLTNERFTGWTGYYTYDPRGSVTGVTDSEGMIWQSYRYNANGDFTFGKPQYNNVYSYNAESYNPNMESQYLRARYYNVPNGNFLTEDSYLGNITDPLTLNRYNYVKSSPLNYTDPSGEDGRLYYVNKSYGVKGLGHNSVVVENDDGTGMLYSYQIRDITDVETLVNTFEAGYLVHTELSADDMKEFLNSGKIVHKLDNPTIEQEMVYTSALYRDITDKDIEKIHNQAQDYIDMYDLYKQHPVIYKLMPGIDQFKYSVYNNNCDTVAATLIARADIRFKIDNLMDYSIQVPNVMYLRRAAMLKESFGPWDYLRFDNDYAADDKVGIALEFIMMDALDKAKLIYDFCF